MSRVIHSQQRNCGPAAARLRHVGQLNQCIGSPRGVLFARDHPFAGSVIVEVEQR
jgi:hypothetical protein